jgi:methylglutaconyl-CoA hydratase
VIRRIGEYGAKELMLTGKRFKSPEAEKWNLVNHVADDTELEETLQKLIKQILSSGPRAVRETKELIGEVIDSGNLDDVIKYTTQMIARLRASEEGQEGMASFLEKRKAKWQQ